MINIESIPIDTDENPKVEDDPAVDSFLCKSKVRPPNYFSLRWAKTK